MNRSLLARAPLVVLFVVSILGLLIVPSTRSTSAQQGSAGQSTSYATDGSVESDLTDVPAAPGTARAAKFRAIEIVEDIEHPDPDLIGTDLRKEQILTYLNGSVDGTFRSDNFLKNASGVRAFEYDANAAKLLRELANDPGVSTDAQDDARQALQKVLEADRKVSTEVLAATDVFGDQKPQAATENIAKAQQELSAADEKISSGRRVSALGNYRRAWKSTNAATNVLWKSVNPGGEKLLPEIEQRMGTDVEKADTDGDGLTDAQELIQTGTDPTRSDPSDADRDSDGLSDLQEIQAGTDPLEPDTDGEGLDDGYEVGEFNSDPTRQDTDSDGLTDDSEKRLGTDPRKADTDSSGRRDGFENYTSQKSANDLGVSVEMNGRGDVARGVRLENLGKNEVFRGTPGRVSTPVDITSEASFYDARVKIEFDPAQVPDNDAQNLKIMYWDDAARVFVPLDNQGVNTEENYAWADTTHFTTFLLVHEPTWYAQWRKDMGDDFKRDPTDPEFKNLDVVLDIDSSGSMSSNDPNGLRKTAAKGFVDALLEGDRTAVVDFDSSAELIQPLTTDFAAAKNAVDTINSSGGTSIGAGVNVSLDELDQNGDPEHSKSIIVLTDGVGDYDPALTQRAKDAGVFIYTVGLGSSVDEPLLRSIAEGTGGAYYPVSSANQLPDLFERIAQKDPQPNQGPDADGDGLSDDLETGGFRGGNGTFVTTSPNDEDTDDDGFTDGEEAGELSFGPDGDYFTVPTNPVEADPDGDGLDDFDEIGIGTDSNNPDSDSDGLEDPTELAENFDPNDSNPDGDSLRDDEELAALGESTIFYADPFHPDRTGWENIKDIGVGFVSGGTGQILADLGVIDSETIRGFGYLKGWIFSNIFSGGDARDSITQALYADTEEEVSDAVYDFLVGSLPATFTEVPAMIDATAEFNSWSPDLKVDTARWATTDTFTQYYEQRYEEEEGTPPLVQRMTVQMLYELGYGEAIQAALLETMSEDDAEAAIEDLAWARNDTDDLSKTLTSDASETAASVEAAPYSNYQLVADTSGAGPTRIFEETYDKGGSAWAEIEDRVTSRWDQSKLTTPDKKAEAYAVEAAVQILEDKGYELLYVGRNTPLKMKEPYNKGEAAPDKFLNQGPDIVAKDPATGKPLIVEVKGSAGKLSLNSSLFKGQAARIKLTQPSLEWLRGRAPARYLSTMEGAESEEINKAADLLRKVISNDPSTRISYDAAWIGYGEKGTTLGKVTGEGGALQELNPDPSNTLGVNNWDIYTVDTTEVE